MAEPAEPSDDHRLAKACKNHALQKRNTVLHALTVLHGKVGIRLEGIARSSTNVKGNDFWQ